MPRIAAAKARSGPNVRGAARINTAEDLPNTKSADYQEKFMGKSSTAEMLGDEGPGENQSPNTTALSYRQVARVMKRPLRERKGVGHGRGKHPKTAQRHYELNAEFAKRQRFADAANLCLAAIMDVETHIVPAAEILGKPKGAMQVRLSHALPWSLLHAGRRLVTECA